FSCLSDRNTKSEAAFPTRSEGAAKATGVTRRQRNRKQPANFRLALTCTVRGIWRSWLQTKRGANRGKPQATVGRSRMVHRQRAATTRRWQPRCLGKPFRPVALRPHFSVSLPLLGATTCDATPRRRRVGCYCV